jgi:Flp pilus assembly protein TadD
VSAFRCPVCRAAVDDEPVCRRCRADLSLLFTIEDQRVYHLTAARDALQQGNWESALTQARQATSLRCDDESRMLQAAAHLLRGDFPAAWECYLRTADHHG